MGPALIPGMTLDVNVANGNSVLYVETDGGIANNGVTGDHVRVEIRVFVDGVEAARRAYDVEVGRIAFTTSWALGVTVQPVAAGTHTVTVQAAATSFSAGSPTVSVGGVAGTNSAGRRGTLNVLVLNK